MDSFRAFRTRAAAFWILTVWASSEESIFTKASATESRRSFAMNFLPYMNQNYFGASKSIDRKFTAWSLRVTRSSNRNAHTGLRVQDLKVRKSLAPSDHSIKIIYSFWSVPLDSRANLFSNKQTNPKLMTVI